jgi:hypothetical protein
MEVSGQFHAPAALPQGKSSWCPLDRRLGWPEPRSGRGDATAGTRTTDYPGRIPALYHGAIPAKVK